MRSGILLAVTRRTCIAALAGGTVAAASMNSVEHVDVFRAGENGFHTFRIPALIATRKGSLLAFAEGRRNGRGDSGEINVVLKRSGDQGRTWSALRIVAGRGSNTIGNPCPVQDRLTGRILLPLTCNPGNVTETQMINREVEAWRTVFLTWSDDDGRTWAPLAEITDSVRKPDWTWYATGPGVGIQTRAGRLVIPCDHNAEGSADSRSHIFYSDDHGATWRLGGEASPGTTNARWWNCATARFFSICEAAAAGTAAGSRAVRMEAAPGRRSPGTKRSSSPSAKPVSSRIAVSSTSPIQPPQSGSG